MEKAKVDPEKLLELVKVRPDIYDADAKCHYNVEKINKLWSEIAEEMGIKVTDCKMKWHSLRTSYARYLREARKKLQPGAKKPNWHLAEAMSFLEEHTLKKNARSVKLNSDTASTDSSVKEEPESQDCYIQEDSTGNYLVENDSNDSEVNQRQNRRRKRSADVLADPMLPFVESVFKVNTSNEEDPMEHFFKGVRPDVNMLDDRRKLKFKAGVLRLINELMEEQELTYNMNT